MHGAMGDASCKSPPGCTGAAVEGLAASGFEFSI